MGPDSPGQEMFRSLLLNQTKLKVNFKAVVLLSEATRKLETENLAEVQLVIDSCCPVCQSNNLNSNKKNMTGLL